MECALLFLAACLMFSGVHGVSQSMSCSTVNGKTICNKETSEGNSAMASSQAQTGGGSSFQRTYAGAGNPGQWGFSSQTRRGGPLGASGFAFSPNLFTGAQAGGGAFAGGGIAVAGNIPFYSQRDDYPMEDYDSFGGAPSQGRGFAGPMPAPSNPFEFVNRFMGRGPVVGGFAAAGAPFGRR